MWAGSAHAQIGGGVTSSGAIVAGHCVSWLAVNVIQDSGSACGGGGSVSITAGSSNIVVSPSPLTGTGTIDLSTTPSTLSLTTSGLTVNGNSAFNGTATITSTSATAFSVGANGATNPVLNINASTASQVGGLTVVGGASGGTTTVTATDSGSNQGLSIATKGTGNMTLTSPTGQININAGSSNGLVIQRSGVQIAQMQGASTSFSALAQSSGATTHYLFQGPLDTGLTASTNVPVFNITPLGARQHATGALALQEDILFTGSPNSFVGASTLTDMASLAVTAPGCGTNGTCTNSSAIYVPTLALVTTGAITNSYGLNVSAATGATNNYAAQFIGRTVVDAVISKGTKFTTSGCSVSATTGGATAGVFTLGANTCSVIITLNGATGATAPNGWACNADDLTASTVFIGQSSSTTATATINIPVTAGATDVISFSCVGY